MNAAPFFCLHHGRVLRMQNTTIISHGEINVLIGLNNKIL